MAEGRYEGSLIKHEFKNDFNSSEMFEGIGICSLTIFIMAEKGFKSKLGGFPCKSSIIVHPTDQMSPADVT